ncbi:hypothetical protein BDP27DRAFT_1370606 [Rhodocollybia butyracea]|uniref:Uncharacterized protein n=1 Tax=Rhodocollybia butyracea TaxID=206335 RepID=A0A9P5PCU1_9AGAR|nr:hypothetical protein BDP27DRAFT_1370606 [Rhodocollybia butyracea]
MYSPAFVVPLHQTFLPTRSSSIKTEMDPATVRISTVAGELVNTCGLCAPLCYLTTLAIAQGIKQRTEPPRESTPSLEAVLPLPLPVETVDVSAWRALQALGGDMSVLGGELNHEPDGEQGSDSDFDTGGSEPLDLPANLHEGQKASINAQIRNLITHKARSLLPRLYGMESTLAGASNLSETPEIMEFIHTLDSLSSALSKLLVADTKASDPASPQQQNDPIPRIKSRKLICAQYGPILWAPSPEMKQIWKISRGYIIRVFGPFWTVSGGGGGQLIMVIELAPITWARNKALDSVDYLSSTNYND